MRVSTLLLAASAALAVYPAGAQTSSYRTAAAQTGKPTRLWTVTAIRKDCTVGDIGGVKVVSPPKNGTLSLSRGKLKSPASFRCPNLETPVELVIYVPKAKFTGQDEVSFETKSADGTVEKHTFRIEVSDKPVAPKKPDQTDL